MLKRQAINSFRCERLSMNLGQRQISTEFETHLRGRDSEIQTNQLRRVHILLAIFVSSFCRALVHFCAHINWSLVALEYRQINNQF